MNKTDLKVIDSFDQRIEETYSSKSIALSNALAQAKEKTSLLESKIEFLAIYKMEGEKFVVDKVDSKGKPYQVNAVSMSTREIRDLMNRKGGSIYEELERAAIELKQKLYIYRDPGHSQFTMKNLYGDVEYKDGKFTVEFNPDTEYLFSELKSNFVKMKLEICFKFKTNGGFQLYKILKSQIYDLPDVDPDRPQEEQKVKVITTSLSELRLQLGYVDLNLPEIRKEGAKKNPDVEKMNNLEKKPKYKRWTDFYKRVIEPGVKEINKISDVHVASVEKACGAHGKVEDIVIKVQKNVSYVDGKKPERAPKAHKVELAMSNDEIMDILVDIRVLMGITTAEAKSIAEKAGYNIELIKEKWDLRPAEFSKGATAWMLDAIDKDYKRGSTDSKKQRKKNGFDNFKEREYDFDQLEREVIN